MDDEAYETNLRVFQKARTTAVLTASITAFITFAAFMIAGFDIQVTAAWMFALSLMSGSALFVVMHIVTTNDLKRTQRTPQP
ncbi:hypothetical protein [Brevibacterium zhoupengii]|uniref:hypothetical protein n=1 Tax=Brevibacterium zhoupengii TaxID=2898795 RepID=UPI001F088E7D|nr:hypothetical protein [Brevibacterium zhoupengii]